MARGLGEQLAARVGARVGLGDGLEAVEIEPRVIEILIGGEAAHAFGGERARGLGERGGFGFEVGERRLRGALAGERAQRHRQLVARGREAGAEAAQIALDRLAVVS